MGKRVYSSISKFKKVEAALRSAANSFRPALAALDEALTGPRSPDEKALLRSIRDQTARVHDETKKVIHRLYSEVES